jgi:hypothetical protein
MQLTYLKAGQLCLSDLGVAERVLGSKAFHNLVEYLFAVPAQRMRLMVNATSNVEALAAYWGRGGREELIKPLLASLARVPGGADISISALLPDFARLRLNRFPDREHDGPTVGAQDCIYSAMNFFRAVPDTNFLDSNYVQAVLKRDYEPVAEAPTFGDLILIHNEADELIHMCVFIAEEFVFTKNGMTSMEPWTLMRLEDVIGIYCGEKSPAKIGLLRLKEMQVSKTPAPA